MLLIFISLITGYIGFSIGSTMNAEVLLGFVGFLSPTLFLVQKIYTKLEDAEDGSQEYEDEDPYVTDLQMIEASFMNCKVGREFKTQEIIDMVKFKYQIKDSSITPSDYCYNRMNIDKWKNPKLLDFNIFEYKDRNTYRYLGGNYPYNGIINYKTNGSSEDIVVGEWNNGEKTIYDKTVFNIEDD